MLDRRTPPTYRQIEQINFPAIELRHLSNGVPLHILRAGKQEVSRIEIVFRTGSYYESTSGQAYFAAKMLSEGAGTYSSKELSRLFDQYGAHIDISSGYEFTTLSLYCLSKHLPILLPVIKEMINTPTFPSEEFTTIQQLTLQRAMMENNKNSNLAGKRFRNLIFGKHPYSKTLEPEAIEKITLTEVSQFFHEQMHGNFEIFLTGNFEDEHLTLVEGYFQDFQLKLAPERVSIIFEEIREQELVIEKNDSLQSSFRYGKVLFGLENPNYPAFSVLNTVLGGYFGSRLMKVIREEKGYTYGIHSSIIPLREKGFFVIGADVIKDKTSDTFQEIDRQLTFLQENSIPEEELETVKNYMLGHFLASVTSPFAIADKYKNVYLKGLNMEYYSTYFDRILETSAVELKQLAMKYLSPDTLNKVIVG